MTQTSRVLARVSAFVTIVAYAGVATADHRFGHHGAAGPYVGGGITRVDVDESANLGLFGAELEDTSFKAYLGYAASDALRLELGYVDFGEYQDLWAFPAGGLQPIALEAEGVTLGAEVGVPLAEDISLFAKGGLVFWDAGGFAGGFGVEEEGEDPFFGAGVRFRLAPNLEITGSFERYALDDVDVDVSTLGLSLRF